MNHLKKIKELGFKKSPYRKHDTDIHLGVYTDYAFNHKNVFNLRLKNGHTYYIIFHNQTKYSLNFSLSVDTLEHVQKKFGYSSYHIEEEYLAFSRLWSSCLHTIDDKYVTFINLINGNSISNNMIKNIFEEIQHVSPADYRELIIKNVTA
jgi:hypothetical protein